MKKVTLLIALLLLITSCNSIRHARVTKRTQRFEQRAFNPQQSKSRKKQAKQFNKKHNLK